jgi:hypothetical protein
MKTIMQFLRTFKISTLLLTASLASWSQSLQAVSVFTNFDGMSFGLSIPETNFAIGKKVPAVISISNATSADRNIRLFFGDPCRTPIGEFLVYDIAQNKPVSCTVPEIERIQKLEPYTETIAGEDSEGFDGELTSAFGLTHPGEYRIQAKYTDEEAAVTTPPIVIRISTTQEEEQKTTGVVSSRTFPSPSNARASALSLSISIPSSPDGEHILDPHHIQHFHVVLSNAANEPQRVWAPWSESNDRTLAFEFIGPDGIERKVRRKVQQHVSRKLPEATVLQPRESLVFNIDYTDPNAWMGFPQPMVGLPSVQMRAVFEIQNGQDGVWNGRIYSEPVAVKCLPQ